MNAKETAHRLSIKFCDTTDVIKPNYASIKHAIKATDEVISALKITVGHLDLSDIDFQETQKDIQFWIDVKNELNNDQTIQH